MAIRFCTASLRNLIQLGSDGKLTGFLAATTNEELSILRHWFNVTITLSDKVGGVIHGDQYDGCLGLIQKNRSDILLPTPVYPTIAAGLVNGVVTSSERTFMVTAYNNTFASAGTDVMDAFLSFSQTCSIVIVAMNLLLAVVFLVILLTHYQAMNFKLLYFDVRYQFEAKQMILSALSRVQAVAIGNILEQHTAYKTRSKRTSSRLILLSWSVMMFIVSLFFASLIKTEKVVFEKPDTISSYPELLAHPNVRPVWGRTLTVHDEFKNAKPDTILGKVWERGKSMGMDQSMINLDLSSIRGMLKDIFKRKSVWFVPTFAVRAIITNFCSASRSAGSNTDVNMWIKSDPDASESLHTVVKSAGMSNSNSELVDKVFTVILEHNLLIPPQKMLEYCISPYSAADDVRECVANRIIYPDRHEIRFLDVNHFRGLVTTIIFMLMVTCCAFLSEILINNKMKAKTRSLTSVKLKHSNKA
jgi:hypothetical protein